DARPFELSDLPPLPEKCPGFSATAVNWTALYDEIWKNAREFAQKHGKGGEFQMVEDGWKQFQDAQGWSVRDDLLSAMGQIHVVYNDPAAGAVGGIGFGIAVQAADAAKLRTSLDRLLAFVPQAGPNALQVMRSEKQGQQVISIGKPGIP